MFCVWLELYDTMYFINENKAGKKKLGARHLNRFDISHQDF